MASNKEIRDVENFSAIPLSNESIKKKRNNLLKSVIGASVIATGLTMMPQASFAQMAEQPPAIVQKESTAAPGASASEARSASVSDAPATEAATETKAGTADPGEKKNDVAEVAAADSGADASNATPVAQNAEVRGTEKAIPSAVSETGLETSEEKPAQAQGAGETAPAEATEPNYAEDEKKVGSYRDSQIEPGQVDAAGNLESGGPTHTENNLEMDFKDGVRYKTMEPGANSPDKKKFGIEIEIDKEKGQRTYTEIGFTNSGNLGGVLDAGATSANDIGEKLAEGFKDPNYKAEADLNVTNAGRQRNVNIGATEKDLKHINSKDNSNTTMAWQGKYKVDNPNGLKATQGDSASFYFTVNPWPNENDKLQLMKLEGEYKDKVFVQGQEVNTGIKVENLDDNGKERLVGQVYNPITGEVVEGASAYIDANGIVKVKMPEGAVNKDGTINKDSIFYKDPSYKGIQNLDVRFFARPRTKAEFENVATENNKFTFGDAKYVGTDAGTGTINHKGEDVTIDKQGIDRYDHYNLIGKFNLNLDDTRYYDQSFLDENNEDTSKNTSSAVKPGEPFEVKIYEPKDSLSPYIKSAEDMNKAKDNGEAFGEVILDFINKANEGKEDKDQWKVTLTDGDIGKFTITPPKSAKAGDFVAVPVEYTYTNGSKDTHWFHFVVQESDNYRPEYHAEIGFKGDKLTSTPDPVPEDTKKNKPLSYELVPGTYKDSAGNVWDNITVDKDTGVVTATVPEQADIKGGENLYVDVKVNYVDEYGVEKEETVKAQFIARPKYKQEVTKEFTSKIPFETKVVYDDTLEAGKVVKTEGVVGETKTTFKQVVINGEKGIINDKGEFVKDQEFAEVKTVKEKQDAVIRIGTKPATTEVTIPRETEYVLDYTKNKGEEPTVLEEGNDGVVTVTTKRDPNTGLITMEQSVTTEAKNKKISIPARTEGTVVDTDEIPFGYTVEFDPDFYTNYPDATDNYKIVKDGVAGTNKKTWTIVNSKIVGDYVLEKTDPVNAVIKVGQKDYTGTVTNTVTKEVPYTVKVVENPNLEAGKTNVKQEGKAGSRTFEYSGEIVNGRLKDDTSFMEKELTDAYVAPKDHIIEIGTKPVENEKSVESEVGVDVEWVFDENKGLGTIEVSDLTPGKVTTRTRNKYNPETGQIETIQETVVEKGKRKVIVGMQNYNGEFEEVKNNIIPYETEIVFDDTLKAGEKVIDQAGENGETVTRTKRRIENGKVVSSEEPVVEKTKDAKNQIIRVGTMTDGKHSHTEKLPFETKVVVNPELKKGEWRYKTVDGAEQKGKLGSRTTEWTIKNSEVQGDPTVTEDNPVDAIIEVGSADFEGEVKHTEHFEIPFEVEIVYNHDLPAGTSNVKQQGVKGSYDVEYKQAIKNGEADGEMTKTESNKVEAKKHIIEIGTKVETPENNYSKDVEVEIEYVYDNTKDKGVVETGELIPGKVETKVVDKYDSETGKVEQSTEQVVTKAKQKVIVGTKDFTGTYEYKKTCPIPFEVEVREDPTLSKGEKKIEQQGVAGSKTTSYEQAIKNGQPDGQARQVGEPTIVEPTKHIVLVGTKSLEGNREYVVDKAIPYGTKVIYDENLEAGTRIVDNEGKDGTERVTTTIATKDGTIEYNSQGTVIVAKEDRVVRVGIKPVVKEEAIPFEKEFEHDPNLEAGKTEKISDGTPGKVTITTSFNKETGKLETKVVRTEPTKAKYKYGSKTTGEVKVKSEIPYEVEIIEDDTMDAGTHKVVQEGEVGEKETTIIIENSGEKSRSDQMVKEAVNKIIRVGTKPNDKMCPVPEDPSTPDNPVGDKPNEPGMPSNPGAKPNEPGTPGNPGAKPNEPGTPGNPGAKPNEPGTPGNPGAKPNEPGTPGNPGAKPNEPGTPGNPGDKPNEPNAPNNSAKPNPSEPSDPDTSEGSVPNRASQVDEEDGSRRATPSSFEGGKVSGDAKAPQTFDPGVAAPAGLAALASGLLVGLERLKRRKRD